MIVEGLLSTHGMVFMLLFKGISMMFYPMPCTTLGVMPLPPSHLGGARGKHETVLDWDSLLAFSNIGVLSLITKSK